MSQYVDTTVTQDSHNRSPEDAAGTTYTMKEVQFTPKGKHSFQRWYRCVKCDKTLRKDHVYFKDGAPYCKKDYLDLLEDDRKKAI